MKKLIFILFFLTVLSASAQRNSFAIISSLNFSTGDRKAILDSLVREINSINGLSFVLFTGNLTSSGTRFEFEILKNSLDSLKYQYILLPSGKDNRDAEGWNSYIELFGDDKFAFNGNYFVFTGINPALPFREKDYYTEENIQWLKETLDAAGMGKEIYFYSPIEFEKASNWQKIFNLLQNKNTKIIFSVNAGKFLQRNLNGINIIDIPAFSETSNSGLYISFISKDSIVVSDPEQNTSIIIDKTIQIDKQPIEISEPIKGKVDILSSVSGSQLTYASPIYWNGHLYTSSYSGTVACYDSTGNFKWDYNTFGNIIGTPLISDRIVAVSTLQGDLITLSAITGEQIQTIGFEEMITTDLGVIEYSGNKILMIPKLTKSKSAIIFGTASGKVYCYDLETLQEYWVNSNTQGMIRSNPVSIENKVLFTGNDGFLYCIDSRNGLMIWRWKEKAETDFSDSFIESDGKKVFIAAADGNFYAIDLMLGKLNWRLEEISAYSRFTIDPDRKLLLIKGEDSKIYFVNPATGKILKETKFDGKFSNSSTGIIPVNGTALFANNGSIYKSINGNKSELIYSADFAPFNYLSRLSSDRFIASNYNGHVIIFSVRKN